MIGRCEGLHYESLHFKYRRCSELKPQYTEAVVVKLAAGSEGKTIDRIQNFYGECNPGFALDYRFFDQDYQALYGAEQRVATLRDISLQSQ